MLFCIVLKMIQIELCTFAGVDFHTTVVKVDGEKVALQLWDTAGQERYGLQPRFHLVHIPA